MVSITGSYEGGLRCRAKHGPSGAELVTDAPVDNHGKGEAFSPTDLLATSLGVCMITIMGIWAQRNDVDLGQTSFEVQKEMSATPPRRVATLRVRINVPTVLPEETRQRLEAAAMACPVKQSLHPDVKCDIAFTWAA